MTDHTTPADVLREAATLLRKLSAHATEGPWETTWRGQEYHLDGYQDGDLHPISEWTYAIATWEPQASEQRAECDTANADFIAAMHPGVALAFAELLEAVATDAMPCRCASCPTQHALAVARAVLTHPTPKEQP